MTFKNKIHGIVSLGLMDIAFVVSLYSIALESIFYAALYFVIAILMFGVIIFTFCNKCLCRDDCSHVFLGPITRIMPKRKQSPYTRSDYIITAIALLIFLSFPQYWLLKSPILASLFWGLLIIASLQINKYVCTRCNNKACAMCRNKMLMGKPD